MRCFTLLSQIVCFSLLFFSFALLGADTTCTCSSNDYSLRVLPVEGITILIIENQEKLNVFRGLIAGTVDIHDLIKNCSPDDLQMYYFLLSQEQELWTRGREGRGNLELGEEQSMSVCKALSNVSAIATYAAIMKTASEYSHAQYARNLAVGVTDISERGVGDKYFAHKMSVLLNGIAQNKDTIARKWLVATGLCVGCVVGFVYLDDYLKKQYKFKQRQNILKRIDLLIAELAAAGITAEPAAQAVQEATAAE